jgi:hypothetical protein
MKLEIKTSAEDLARLAAFVRDQSAKKVVRDRFARNLAPVKMQITQDRFWRAFVCMRLTSRQKSGPDSAVSRFKDTRPFALDLKIVRANSGRTHDFILSVLQNAGGLRDYNVAANQFTEAFVDLENGLWQPMLARCNELIDPRTATEERLVADYIAGKFNGIGPKQSRNILQALGLTRYEIPLDSRVMKWLRGELGFPLPLNGQLLADDGYYHFVLDMIQDLCEKCDTFPCVLDAAIFAENDPDTWTDEQLFY